MKKAHNICSICGKKYRGYGNNAEPVNSGRCCNECNILIVLPARMNLLVADTLDATNVASEDDPEIDILKELDFENFEIANTDNNNLIFNL